MASFTNLARPTASGTAQKTVRRDPLAEWFGLEPLDLINQFAPLSRNVGVEVSRSERGYVVEIPVPGFAPNQIEITYKDSVLTISGKSDRRTFTRSLVVPEEVDPDLVKASVEHGLLTLNLDRRPEAEPKRITISAN
jgi:HSP20 family protein